MTGDPLRPVRQADVIYRRALAKYEDATDARREAILAAVRDGVTVADIARALEVTHEAVRKVVRAAGL